MIKIVTTKHKNRALGCVSGECDGRARHQLLLGTSSRQQAIPLCGGCLRELVELINEHFIKPIPPLPELCEGCGVDLPAGITGLCDLCSHCQEKKE